MVAVTTADIPATRGLNRLSEDKPAQALLKKTRRQGLNLLCQRDAENADPVPRHCMRMARQACGSGYETGNPQTSELSQSNGRQMTQAVDAGCESTSEKSGEQRCVVDLRRRGKVSSLSRSTKTT
jgi:hypothetical protein